MSSQSPQPGPHQPRLTEILEAHLALEGPLLPILHAVQAEWGHVPPEVEPAIARALNISRAELHGVITFYHDFRAQPAGRHRLRLCRAEACQAMGGAALEARARQVSGLDWHETSADGALTLEPVFCLGLCACGPAAEFDGVAVARLTEAGLDALIEKARA